MHFYLKLFGDAKFSPRFLWYASAHFGQKLKKQKKNLILLRNGIFTEIQKS